MCLTENGQLFACGEMDSGKLGCDADANADHFSPQLVNMPHRVTSVSCGHNHTIAVTGLSLAAMFSARVTLLNSSM